MLTGRNSFRVARSFLGDLYNILLDVSDARAGVAECGVTLTKQNITQLNVIYVNPLLLHLAAAETNPSNE
jgi:hypothetical protein